MLRIGILTHGSSPFGFRYAKAFLERGHEVRVISMCAYDGGHDWVEVDVLDPDFDPGETSARWMPYLRQVFRLRKVLRRTRPDVVFALCLSSAGVVASLSGHPCLVASARGSEVVNRIGSRLWRGIFGRVCRRAALVHAVSEPLADALAEHFGVDREGILVAPLGVDTKALAFVDPSRRPHAGRVFCNRAHKAVYDQPTLVRAIGRLVRRGMALHVTFAHPLMADATRRLVVERGLEDVVTFMGGYTDQELANVLAAADVYVSTSLSDGTSNSLLEAMSTGLFPVVSDIPANRPWVEHGRNGLLFPPGDDEALADRLAEALADPEQRARAAPVNRRMVVEKGDVRRQAVRLLAAFGRCAAAGGGRGGNPTEADCR